MPMDDVDQMLVNELARLDRAIAARKKRLDAVPEKPLRCAPKRYVVDLPIKVQSDSDLFAPVTRSVVVDRTGKAFRPRQIVATPTVIGTLTDLSSAAKISLAPENRALSFQWQVRDTYTDRTWSNAPLPDLALASGKNGGLDLDAATKLPPGTIIEVTVMPILTAAAVSFFLSAASEYAVQFAFVGDEVY